MQIIQCLHQQVSGVYTQANMLKYFIVVPTTTSQIRQHYICGPSSILQNIPKPNVTYIGEDFDRHSFSSVKDCVRHFLSFGNGVLILNDSDISNGKRLNMCLHYKVREFRMNCALYHPKCQTFAKSIPFKIGIIHIWLVHIHCFLMILIQLSV